MCSFLKNLFSKKSTAVASATAIFLPIVTERDQLKNEVADLRRQLEKEQSLREAKGKEVYDLRLLLAGKEVCLGTIRSGNPDWVPKEGLGYEGYPSERFVHRTEFSGRCEGSGGRPIGCAWTLYVKMK